eukprot:890295-Prymnesium_polylepis.1
MDGGGGVVAVGLAAAMVRPRPPKEGERAATSAAKTSSSTVAWGQARIWSMAVVTASRWWEQAAAVWAG